MHELPRLSPYEERVRRVLEARFAARDAAGVYCAHQPIYGYGHASSAPGHLMRFSLNHAILRVAAHLRFESVLDVGGAEGYLAHLLRTCFGAEAFSVDLSAAACGRARQLFDLPSLAVSASALPFPDASFDLVTCSEVIEHLEDPIAALRELRRVARRAVLVTTEEFCSDALAAHLERFTLADHAAHAERNLFTRADLEIALGPGAFREWGQRKESSYSEHLSIPAARAALREIEADPEQRQEDEVGVILLQVLDEHAWGEPRCTSAELWERLFAERRAPESTPLPDDGPWHPAVERRCGPALRRSGAASRHAVPVCYRPAEEAALDAEREQVEALRRVFLGRPLPAPSEQLREASFLERVREALHAGALPALGTTPAAAREALSDPEHLRALITALYEPEPFLTGRIEGPLQNAEVREGDPFQGWAVAYLPIQRFALRIGEHEFDLGPPRRREDLAARFPDQPHALWSGFAGSFLGVARFAGEQRLGFWVYFAPDHAECFATLALRVRA
jgi:SAM-dependent methyltransferase